MSEQELGIENNTQKQFASQFLLREKRSRALSFILKTGIVKTEKGAAYMLLGIAILFLVTSFLFL